MGSIRLRRLNAVVRAPGIRRKGARPHRWERSLAISTFAVLTCVWPSVGFIRSVWAQSGPAVGLAQNGVGVSASAKGTFEIKLTPQPADGSTAGVFDRMSADK